MILININQPKDAFKISVARDEFKSQWQRLRVLLGWLSSPEADVVSVKEEILEKHFSFYFFDGLNDKEMIAKSIEMPHVHFTFYLVDDFVLFTSDKNGSKVDTIVLRESELIRQLKDAVEKHFKLG